MADIKNLICVSCPMGCRLEVTVENSEVLKVTGNQCARGVVYAKKEVVNPTRVLTSILPVRGGVEDMVSVKTQSDIPKSMLRECVASLKGVIVDAPIRLGDVIISNLCGTNVALIATKSVRANTMDNTYSFTHPIGSIWLHIKNNALVGLNLDRADGDALPPFGVAHSIAQSVIAYLDGTSTKIDVPYQLTGSPFEVAVYRALMNVPYGQTIAYGELAKRAGYEGAARAVGSAMRKNPLPLLVPCHRVIKADGSLGEFTGGVALKKRLLAIESTIK
jgi:O-6-methylguanine DNA methyltransferase